MRTLILLALGLSLAAQSPGDTPVNPDLLTALQLQQAMHRVTQEVYPAVVTVTGYERDPNAVDATVVGPTDAAWVLSAFSEVYPGFRKTGIGSGVVVSEEGEVLTCLSLIQKADGSIADLVDIETTDRVNTIAAVLAVEPTLNLALLKLQVFSKGNPPQYKVAKWGNSENVLPGHLALTVGDPFGPERHFSYGMITTPPSRDCYQEMLTATYMQCSLLMHPQAYGGALVNLRGELIGIMMPRQAQPGTQPTRISTGIEFAMPSDVVQGIYRALRMKRSFRSPWLGFAVMSRAELRKERGPDAFKALAKPRFGIYIENTFNPGPAVRGGIKPGDFLVKFDGEVIHTPIMFQRALYLAGIGSTVTLEMFRDGKTIEVPLEIEARPAKAITR